LERLEVLGLERRRRWSDAAKMGILSEVRTNGWTLADVARRHDLTRQQLYRWRHELRTKGCLSDEALDAFVPVELAVSTETRDFPVADAGMPEVTIILLNGRQLRCREAIAGSSLTQLLHVLEAS
jgi:transposase